MHTIEMVKRWATRFVTNEYNHIHVSSVTEMITNIGLDTLQTRRDLVSLNIMFRIVHSLVGITVEPYRTPSTSMTRGHNLFPPEQDVKHHLPTELPPKNSRLVEPIPPDCSEPDNTGGLPEPAGRLHLLNVTPCSLYLLL